MASAARDPRAIVTPDAFSVAPGLLGTPLARPWRRAVAILVDLILIGLLSRAGWFFLGLAIAILLFRRALRPARGLIGRGSRWLSYGSLGTLVLAVTLAGGWASYCAGDGPSASIGEAGRVLEAGLGDVGGTVADVIAMSRAETEPEFREAAASFVEHLSAQGVDQEEIRGALEDFAREKGTPWAQDAVEAALAGVDVMQPAEVPVEADSLVISYAAALQAGDSGRAARLRPEVVEALAAERLVRQERRIEQLQEGNTDLERRLREAEEEPSLISVLLGFADEVGIGFGWAGLYFTLFVALWRGRTPGKRLMRIRVVRLDGKPIGWWVAFNRFGGYAASIFTGLLGFFEMFWDDNRMALHDRIASTVVVRE
ncbi:MAG: RDD family protein [Gemmatimonadota bacterium]|nr:MAG: RDD family protein [Gemmatimonadota bacterium]